MGLSRPHSNFDPDQLINELCSKLGFCLPTDDRRRLCESPPADVDSFTAAVFEAEGTVQPYDKGLHRQVRELVERHMSRARRDS